MQQTAPSTSAHFPTRASGIASSVGFGGPGLMLFLKEYGFQLPTWIVWVVGIVSVVALGTAGFQIIRWLWHYLMDQRRPDSKFNLLREATRRRLIPLLLGTMAIAGVALLMGATLGTIAYFRSPQGSTDSGGKVVEVPPKPLKRMFTAYDLEAREKAIDHLLEFLDPKLMAISSAGERLNQSLYKRIADGNAIEALDQFNEAAYSGFEEYFKTTAQYQHFSDIYQTALSHDWNPMMLIHRASSLLRDELQEMMKKGQLDNLQPEQIAAAFRNNKFMHDWRELTGGKIWQWIDKKKNALTVKRREYEQAEVYPVNKTENITPDQGEPFAWNFAGLLGGMVSERGHHVAKIWVEGVNKTEEPLPITRSKITSLITGTTMDMKIRTNRGYVRPDEANAIPPRAPIYLHALFYDPQTKKPNEPEGITAAQFLAEWGSLRFEVEYTHHMQASSWSRVFDYNDLKARVDAMNPHPQPTPRVTKRDS